MAKKISQEEYEKRILKISPTAQFKIINYTTISKECTIQCLQCGQIKTYQKASSVLKHGFCCDNRNALEIAKQQLEKTKSLHFIKYLKNQEMVILHDDCNNTFIRKIALVIKNPEQCPYCSNNKGIVLEKEEIQKRLDEEFQNTIEVLEYNAIRAKNTYKCLKCGLIFKSTQKNLMASRGCPKCDKYKSKGEKQITKLLDENNIYYQREVAFPDLSNGKQRFDFIVYKDKKYTEIDYIIECNGEQHYEQSRYFKETLEKVQARDQKKRDYCKEKGYTLYEIKYINCEFQNLDILPFLNNS